MKSITFLQKPAVAVYFYNFTAQVQSFYLNHADSNESVATLRMAESVQETITASVMLLDNFGVMSDPETMITCIQAKLKILMASVSGYIDWKMI